MRSSLFAISSLCFGSFVAAAPLRVKRDEDVVVVTSIDIVTEVIETTTTVWVDAGAAPTAAPVTNAEFFERPGTTTTSSASSSTTSSSSSSSSSTTLVVVTPTPESTPEPTPTPIPTTSSTPPAAPPAPTTTVAPVVPVIPVTQALAPSSTSAAPVAQTSSSSSSGSGASATYTGGDLTYYDPDGGLGSCGPAIQNSDDVVALPHGLMDAVSSLSNGHPWCGKKIAIYFNGQTFSATVGDRCGGCDGNSIDLTSGLFQKVTQGKVDGRGVGLASWSFV